MRTRPRKRPQEMTDKQLVRAFKGPYPTIVTETYAAEMLRRFIALHENEEGD